MSALQRQNTLFVSEDWIRIYNAIQNVEFRAYDFDNLVSAILNHLRDVFPEEFNDWIASSEFIMKVEVLAWLSQNIAFRIDLNTRENFLATAERRDSLIRLAQNVSYKISRVRGARGQVRIETVRTNQALFDSNNIALQDREVTWSDPRNEDFFEQFIIVMNAAFASRTPFGRPLTRVQEGSTRVDQYVFNGQAPDSGSFNFSTSINGVELPFDIINAKVNKDTGQFEEFSPSPENAYNVFFNTDGRGLASDGTGFFFQLRQGRLQFQDEEFVESEIIRIVEIDVQNINNNDFFVQELDANGLISATWEQVDTVFGESVSFLPTDRTGTLDTTTGQQGTGDARKVYEIDTLENDRVRIRFGDGKFGEIPVGTFRFWYRTSNPQPQVVNPSDIGLESFTLPYVVNGTVFLLTMTVSLKEPIVNAATSETNFSIRTRANQVYYAQNRMITGRDYNSFFLRDNAIRKVKTVNRTFSGQSRFAKLHDPTGLYENLKIVASDGRYFQERVRGVTFATADVSVVQLPVLIQDFIEPQIQEANKENLYYNDYPEQFFATSHFWFQDSIVSFQSRGRLVGVQGLSSTAVPVGDATLLSPDKFITTDAVLRLSSPRGATVRVDRVIDDGDIVDGIILERVIEDDIKIVSVFPPFRTNFTDGEKVLIEQQLELKLDFGLTWVLETQTWDIITADNLDKQEPNGLFCLDNQGDTSGLNLDQSWMVYLEFVPGGVSGDKWKIVDRGLGTFFESARENDFFFASNESVIDPDTGQVARDSVIILECNESRDSLRRRSVANITLANILACDLFCYEFLGDGTTVKFTTKENPLNPNSSVTVDDVLQILGVDYTIETKVSGDSIVFVLPPSDGAQILVCISLSNTLKSQNTIVKGPFQGDGIDFAFLMGSGAEFVNAENAFVWIDGVFQRANVDYTFNNTATFSEIVLTTPLAAGAFLFIYLIPNISNGLFARFTFTGDGVEDTFPELAASAFNVGNQTENTVMVYLDGVFQDSSLYTVVSSPLNTRVEMTTPPAVGVIVHIILAIDPSLVRTDDYSFGVADGITSTFVLTDQSSVAGESTLVFLDGILQVGPWDNTPPPPESWAVSGPNSIFFPTPPPAGLAVSAFVILGGVGIDPSAEPDTIGFTNNLGNISTSSLLVQYLGEDVPLFVEDVLRSPDGYVDENGLEVIPADTDNSGFTDNPFLFKDIVLQDGFTDLVLWRKIEEFGFSVFDPIGISTRPRGTYGLFTQGDIFSGEVISTDFSNLVSITGIPDQVLTGLPITAWTVFEGDIHYDISTATWLVADVLVTGTWIVAPDQTIFKFEIGRANLKFMWLHFAPDAFRIDPSVSNVMDAFILTTAFDDAFRTALFNNTPTEDLPEEPSSEELRIQFADFENFKAMSDAIIYHTARYKILFGQQAIPALQATFKVIQTEGSLLSENDLRLRILEVIDLFFSVDNFDFGETFYMTELLAFIHQELATNIQSVVAVPKQDEEAFGRLFQIRAEPDQLFISSASAEDIELVTAFTDEELRIGTIL